MAAIRVKPVEHRVQVQSVILSRNQISKKAKRCLFGGGPQPGETAKLFEKDQQKNIKRLLNYKLVINPENIVNFDVENNFGSGNNEDQMKTIKRPGSPRITDHFKLIKKVCRQTSMTTKEKLSDVEEQCIPEASEIGSTNFVTNNVTTSDSTLESDAICTDEPLPSTIHQQIQEQLQEEVTLHIMMTNHAGKFS